MNYVMYINKNKSKKILVTAFFLIILCYLLVFAKVNFNLTKEIVTYFINILIPSLFPFLLFSEILINTNISYYFSRIFAFVPKYIFRLPVRSVVAIIIGFLCGYPNGAKCIISLFESGDIDRKTAEKLLSFLNNCNPVFILSSIGIGVFCDLYAGLALAISHYISAIIIGIFSKSSPNIIHDKTKKANNIPKNNIKNNDNVGVVLKNTILNAFSTLIIILGFIVIFNILGKLLILPIDYILKSLNIPNRTVITAIFNGLFEMTNGINGIAKLSMSYELKMCITSFFLSFSGLAVIFQIYVVISKDNFKLSKLILSKLIQGILSVVITYILINTFVIFKNPLLQTVSVEGLKDYTYISNGINVISIFVLIISIIIIIFSAIEMLKISRKKSNKV